MKKVLITLLVIVLLIVGALIAAPYLFKDEMVAFAKDAANEQLDATVDFGDFDLSFFRSFPNLSFRIEDVTVDNHAPFEGVRLAEIGALEFTINLMPLLNGNVVIKELGIIKSSFDVRVTKDEAANYNIMKESDEVEEVDADTTASEFNIELQRYYLKDINVKYHDVPLVTDLIITGLDHEGSGDFTQDLFTLSTTTTIESMDVIYDGIQYLRKAKLDAQADLDIDANNYKYTLKENTFQLNELALGLDGWVAMPEDPIDMDLTFYAKEAEFRHFLSLVPAEFASDLQGVDVSGSLALNGLVRGTYDEENYPAFGLDLNAENGRFKYPDLPASAENISIFCNIEHPGGDLDRMVIDLSKFHMELADNPIDFRLLLKTLMSDPDIDASVQASLDFANLAKVVPMEEEMSGSFSADLNFKGHYSAIEKERYEDFHADGKLQVLNFEYHEEGGYDIFINEVVMSFTPQYAELSQLNLRMEGMDMAAQGRLENYIAYALKDSMLVGQLSLQSEKIDLNVFMDDDEVADDSEEAEAEEESAAFEIPDNIRFNLDATIAELIYDDLTIRNVKGGISVANQIVAMNDLNMDVLEGNVLLNGSYNAQNPQQPKADFAFDARNLDIQQTATSFVTVEKFAPLAKNATGKFSTKMTFKSDLDNNLDPVMESIYGKGSLESKNVYIEGFEPLNELAKVLKIDRLSKQNIQDVKLKFEILNGRAYVEPFDVKIDQINTNVQGSTGLDQTLDYVMKMNVPTEMLEGGAMDMVTGLMGQAASMLGQEFKMGDNIEVDVLVGGTVEKPTFKPSFGGMEGAGKSAADMAKDKIKEELDKAKDEAVDKAVEEAREQAAKLVSEAEKQADRLRTEAKKQADRVKEEGRSAAKKLEDEAGNPIAKAAARKAGEKLIQEADNKANRIESEADKQAQKVVNEAKQKGDKLINDAEAAVN